MLHPQTPSGMPFGKYLPFHKQIAVEPARPHLADQADHPGAAVVRGRPPGRQPGAHRPDERGAQEADVRPARADGLQGDRGRVPIGEPDRLRLRAGAHRGEPHSRRRDHPGADPVSRPPGAPHLRCDPRVEAGHRPLLQLDVGPPAPRRVRAGPGRHHRHRGPGGPPLPQARGDRPRHRRVLRVLPGPTPAPSSTSRSASATRSSTSSTRPRTTG